MRSIAGNRTIVSMTLLAGGASLFVGNAYQAQLPQFAEHLGHGAYEGIWVGPGSSIPNTRGIRNDVVAALKSIKVPNVRWPGGCFADEYHWRKGV